LSPVVAVICKYATVPDFLRYGTDMQKTAVNQKAIREHGDMWNEIRAIHNRMTFSQQQMVKVFSDVAAENGKNKWPRALTPTEAADMADKMAKRFRVMARHLMQGLVKSRSWATSIMKTEKTSAKTCMKRPAAKLVEDETTSITHGYDHLTGKAFRQRGKKRTLADVLLGDKDEEHPVAIFEDEEEPIVVQQVTNGELRERRRCQLMGRGTIWQAEAADGDVISVKRIPFVSVEPTVRKPFMGSTSSWLKLPVPVDVLRPRSVP